MQIKTIFLLFVLCFALTVFPEDIVEAQSNTILVPDDYSSLFDAVGNASEGDTIYLKSGTYESPINQTLFINKTISLIGEGSETTILNFYPYYYEIPDFPNPPTRAYSSSLVINANNVTIMGLTIVPALYYSPIGRNVVVYGNASKIRDCVITGRMFLQSSNNKFINNSIESTFKLTNASSNYVVGNVLSRVVLEHSDSNLLHNNTCMGFTIGSEGRSSSHNIISRNILNGDNYPAEVWGVYIHSSSNNTIHDNYIANYHNVGYGGWGIVCSTKAVNNTFYRNVIKNNDENVDSVVEKNFWDNGFEGNYWGDYNGTDIDGDGIGDFSYFINDNNHDDFPLMFPNTMFDVGVWEWTSFTVDVMSDFRISNFTFVPEDNMLRFTVASENITHGFFRLRIPKGLLYADENWNIYLDDTPVLATIIEDNENSYIYSSCDYNFKTVEIVGALAIPEYSYFAFHFVFSIVSLLLIMHKLSIKKNK